MKNEIIEIAKIVLKSVYGPMNKRLEIVTFLQNDKLTSIFRITKGNYFVNPTVIECYKHSKALEEYNK
ncbi:MAG: hypothetical protein ABIP51_16690 [Bacteroidia bacterium]